MAERLTVPIELTRTGALMSGYGHFWFLCGGWAVDAWAGRRTRDHLDVDIAVFQDDLGALYEHLAGWDLIGHDPNVPDDSTEPWNGRRLDLPAHIHANSREMNGVELDIQVNSLIEGYWICRDDPVITHDLNCCTEPVWPLPTAPPELVLFYKAGGNIEFERLRDQDEEDFALLLPSLTACQLSWLRYALGRSHPDHPWAELLTD